MTSRYRRQINQSKHLLSNPGRDEVRTSFILSDGSQASILFKRSSLEEAIGGTVDKAAAFVRDLLRRCQAAERSPDFILLVGGTTQIPMVKRVFEQTLDIECRSWSQGREAIALGAAIWANKLWSKDEPPKTLPEEPSIDSPKDDSGQQFDCPICESLLLEITGTGEWICTSCDSAVVVGCTCPECGQELEVEQWGTYTCPVRSCGAEVNTGACATASVPSISVECPHCEGQISEVTGTGDWDCPWCKKGFEVDCSCPECGQELEVEQWGTYTCPVRSCGAEIDTREYAWVAIQSVESSIIAKPGFSLELKASPVGLQVLALAPEAHREMDDNAFIANSHFPISYILKITNRTRKSIKSVSLAMETADGTSHSLIIPEIGPGAQGALGLTAVDLANWVVEPGDQFTVSAVGVGPAELKVTKTMCNKIDKGKALKEQIPCIATVRKATFSSNFVLRIKNITKRPLKIRKFDSPAGSLSSETTIEPQCWEEIGRFELTGGRNFAAGERFRISFGDRRKPVVRDMEGIIGEGKLKGSGGAWAVLGGLGALAAALAGG